MTIKDLVIKCLSSSEEVSFGRVMSAIAFIACISWDTFFVGMAAHRLDFHFMNIHDLLPTTEQLKGQVVFCAACYSINKLTELAAAFAAIWKVKE